MTFELYNDSQYETELKNALKNLELSISKSKVKSYCDAASSCSSSDTSSDSGSQDSKENNRKCTLLLPRGKIQSLSNKCLEYVTKLMGYFPPRTTPLNLGWVALKHIWNITESDIDSAVLQLLQNYPNQQEHILLSLAVIDLSSIVNLSAYLNCLIKEHSENRQVCIYFIAGHCDGECPYMHPDTIGWKLLKEKWGITYWDIDYSDLDHLSKLPRNQIDSILTDLANMDLGTVQNISYYMPYLIHKLETRTNNNNIKRDTTIKPPPPSTRSRSIVIERPNPPRVLYVIKSNSPLKPTAI